MRSLFTTGRSGLLGSKFGAIVQDKYELITTHCTKPCENSVPFKLTDEKDVFQKITSINPDVVIHTAALTDVDYCEDHQREARSLNAQRTANIVKACEETDIMEGLEQMKKVMK